MNKLDIEVNSNLNRSRINKILENGIWLYVLQLFNTVIPLLTIPYVTRILGSFKYGMFSSALNIIIYLQVIVEYGFNLSGARKISIAKDKKDISDIYSKIVYSKIVLLGISAITMFLVSLFMKMDEEQIVCITILFIIVLGTALQQTWIFQGLEIMKYITIITVICRLISTVLIFALIKNSDQIYTYCLIYSLTFLLIGIINTVIISKKLNIKMKKISISDIWEEIKDGWNLFTTAAMSKILSGIGITVLTFTSTKDCVGIYSAIQKIPLILIMAYSPISQVLYPYISRLYTESFNSGLKKIKKICIYVIIPLIIIITAIIFNSKLIVDLLYGVQYSIHFKLLYPLIIWVMFSIVNNLLGIQVLVASGHQKEYSQAFNIGALSVVVFNILFGKTWGMYGVALATMLAESILTILLIIKIKSIKKKEVE